MIHSDLAKTILNSEPTLAIAENCNDETPLQVLAKTPWEFSRNSGQGSITNACNAYDILNDLWNIVARIVDIGSFIEEITSKLLFIAANVDNYEFLVNLVNRCPDCLYKVNDEKHSIFHIAVLHRNVQIFNLIYEFDVVKDIVAKCIDEKGNNLLHQATKLTRRYQFNAYLFLLFCIVFLIYILMLKSNMETKLLF